MLRTGKWRVGWLGFEGDPISSHIKVLARNTNDNIIMVVADATANIPNLVSGYAIGCILIDGVTGIIYSNEGSATSCSFVASTGSAGAQGTAGTAGITGSTGPTGPTGAQGTAGTAGTAGTIGSFGATGAAATAAAYVALTIGATTYNVHYQ